MNKDKQIASAVKQVAEILTKASGRKYEAFGIGRAVAFINRLNPNYPFDSVDILDMVTMLLRNDHFPAPDEIDILEQKLKAADFTGGELRWKFAPGVLTAHFYPKRSAARYDIIFSGHSGATTFPLSVTVNIWKDMDEESSHDDECPRFHPVDHEEDCPVFILSTDGREDHSLDDIIIAQQGCECAADDCDCESSIEYQFQRTFDHDEWFADFEKWLLAAHYNALDDYVSAYATHKIEYVNEGHRVVGANCSCGKWTAQSSKDNAKGEMRTAWLEHVKSC